MGRPGSQGEEGEQSKKMESGSRLSDYPFPLQVEDVPDRPSLLLELGEPFLGTGPLGPEIELPTGAMWRPSSLGVRDTPDGRANR